MPVGACSAVKSCPCEKELVEVLSACDVDADCTRGVDVGYVKNELYLASVVLVAPSGARCACPNMR